ncbi:hypothetical protein BGW42_003931 [Actinomortierella wolfii]|nr:hypothetical protein BGW42_003931 [Actinomortierella wolfii]
MLLILDDDDDAQLIVPDHVLEKNRMVVTRDFVYTHIVKPVQDSNIEKELAVTLKVVNGHQVTQDHTMAGLQEDSTISSNGDTHMPRLNQ